MIYKTHYHVGMGSITQLTQNKVTDFSERNVNKNNLVVSTYIMTYITYFNTGLGFNSTVMHQSINCKLHTVYIMEIQTIYGI